MGRYRPSKEIFYKTPEKSNANNSYLPPNRRYDQPTQSRSQVRHTDYTSGRTIHRSGAQKRWEDPIERSPQLEKIVKKLEDAPPEKLEKLLERIDENTSLLEMLFDNEEDELSELIEQMKEQERIESIRNENTAIEIPPDSETSTNRELQHQIKLESQNKLESGNIDDNPSSEIISENMMVQTKDIEKLFEEIEQQNIEETEPIETYETENPELYEILEDEEEDEEY